MLKIVQQLCSGVKTSGDNHEFQREVGPGINKDHYFYKGDCVCTVDFCTLTFKLNDCGYTDPGMAAILDSYREYWTERALTEVKEEKGGRNE